MQETTNLKLPIYNNPDTDTFDLSKHNAANQAIEDAYTEQNTNYQEALTLSATNASLEIVEARKGKANLGEKIAEQDSELDIMAKAKNDLRKLATQNTPKTTKIDMFTNGLTDWETTNGITITANKLNNTSSVGNHLNVALYKGVPNARGIEVTFGDGNYNARFRVAFGTSIKNFAYTVSNYLDSNNSIDVNRVVGGVLDTASLPVNRQIATVNPVANDRIKAILHGQNIQLFLNGVLYGTFAMNNTSLYCLPSDEPIMAGVSWRDAAVNYNYQVSKVRVCPQVAEKYMHFSIDDFIINMKDLTVNSATYASLFDQPMFKWFKEMHDKYGAVFTLNLFYSDGTWNLGSMTNKFKNEFRKNASWLRFGFHAYDSSCDYGDGSITTANALIQYQQVITAITTFASGYNVDRIFRTHNFSGDLATARVWRDATPIGIKGLLSADDTRISNIYLDMTQRDSINKCVDLYDEVEKLYTVKSLERLDNEGNPYQWLENMKNDVTYEGMHNIKCLFLHEPTINIPVFQGYVEQAFKWAVDNNYFFGFPMDYIPEF